MIKKYFYNVIVLFSLAFMPISSFAAVPAPTMPQETSAIKAKESEEIYILDEEDESPIEISYWKEFFRMMSVLGIILGLVLVAAWILRNFLNSRVKIANENNVIKLIERRNLSQKSMLYVVEVYQKQYLIGDSASGGIEVIAVCSPLDEKPLDSELSLKPHKSSFFEILQKKLSEKNFRQKVK